ncbi:hypothetical protein B0F90DRAFT_1622154 [Multifurca ochricompacta]|uniref:Carbohydrate esterase family 16 protein n=1 Tax=Multifurca ochricompacta TaxID=376703 RepID=A0AAD4MBA4_9AGAM|nr:hypothetical protein B0F90DRAFT_1622154 [Multifurca ochricompacta]
MTSSSRLTPTWRGYFRIKKLMVFGDSYSYVGYSAQAPVPTSSSPLGVAFPGQPINEPGLPNWIGYLIRNYGHGHANMIAYDYARRGDTVMGVYANQVSREFLPSVGRKPGWAAWGPSDTVFVTWVGANDCRILYTNDKAEITPIIATLFAAQDGLYRAGARNFLFIDVPPLHMSPIGNMGDKVVRFRNWNDELRRGLATFTSRYPDATVMVFSAWETFSRILSDPARYGFNPADRNTQGGSIWFDFMHPTSRVHNILAGEIAQFLASQPPQS